MKLGCAIPGRNYTTWETWAFRSCWGSLVMAFLAGETSSYFDIFSLRPRSTAFFEKARRLSFFLEMPSTIASLIDSPSSQSSISIPESCSTTLGYSTRVSPTEAHLVPKPLTSRKSILHLPKKASKPALVSRSVTASKPSLHYNCTICWRSFAPPCFTIGQSARVVCIECWRYVFSIGVCWACGEIVFRRTDSISFGWCWWHWGCFSCLICSVLILLLISYNSISNDLPGSSPTTRLPGYFWRCP